MLQQVEELAPSRHPLRQDGRQLPRLRPHRRRPSMDARIRQQDLGSVAYILHLKEPLLAVRPFAVSQKAVVASAAT